ncbi:MAG: glycoside hydrolase family 2 protein [Tidjanibacter sp.]|nr:glycoside hydrolase family 2 protein [Tidjanibacter sp.]
MRKLATRYLLLVVALLHFAPTLSARETYTLNRDWKFFTYSEDFSTIVNLPHQWNSDALGGKLDYYRGTGNYLRYVDFREEWKGKRLYLRFGGANLVTDVLVNGRHIGRHEGGSSSFTFEITDHINFNGRDLLWIIVDNGHNTEVMPTAGNEISYGGLFREVSLIIEEPTHISLDHYSSNGVYIHTKSIDKEVVKGEVEVRISSQSAQTAQLALSIKDSEGAEVHTATQKVRTQKGSTATFIPFEIKNPRLWNGTIDPALYTFNLTLSVGGEKCDEVGAQSGFRHIAVGSEGFLLNGEKYPIRGVLLHRDRALSGMAVTEREVMEDIEFVCEMGANAIRVVGGSHHPTFYRICNTLGIVVINDLPFMGATTRNGKGFFNTENFRNNGKEQLCEMVYQNYNYPSVVAWNLFSELETRGENPADYIRTLHSLAKRLDHTRLTSGWSNQDGEINFITDLVVWSHSFGWMEGMPNDIAVWQEQLHSVPEWNAIHSAVSYKCGGNIFHQSDLLEKPLSSSSWHPERWQTYFHETYLSSLSADDNFWGIFVDGLFDYASVDTHRSAGGVCDMGLVSFNRQARKDAFYLYKALWNDSEDFLHIAERRWGRRSNTQQTIKVYTSLPEAELTINGEFLGAKECENGCVVWENVTLRRGTNSVEVTSRGITDRITIEIPYSYAEDL